MSSLEAEEDIDRISNLPNDVLSYILSFLDTKLCVQTCVLSKKWKSLWSNVPFIYFDFDLRKGRMEALEKLIDTKLFRLQENHQSLCKFGLEEYFANINSEVFNKLINIHRAWLETTIAMNVGVIDISVRIRYSYHIGAGLITLPETIFTSKSLRVLKLDGSFNIKVKTIFLPKLEYMHLKGIKFTFDSKLFRKMIEGCPRLESLYIEEKNLGYEYGYIVIKLSKTIYASKSLKILKLDGQLIKLKNKTTFSLPILESMYLRGNNFQCNELIQKLIDGCPILKSLFIQGDIDRDSDEVFKVSSMTLRNLQIMSNDHKYSRYQNFTMKLEINAPSLKYLCLSNYLFNNFFLYSPFLNELNLLDTYVSQRFRDNFEARSFVSNISKTLGEEFEILTLGHKDILYWFARCDSKKVVSSLKKLIIVAETWRWRDLIKLLRISENLQVLELNASPHCCYAGGDIVPTCLSSSLHRISIFNCSPKRCEDAVFTMVEYFLKHGKVLNRIDMWYERASVYLPECLLLLRRKSSACEIHIWNEEGTTPSASEMWKNRVPHHES